MYNFKIYPNEISISKRLLLLYTVIPQSALKKTHPFNHPKYFNQRPREHPARKPPLSQARRKRPPRGPAEAERKGGSRPRIGAEVAPCRKAAPRKSASRSAPARGSLVPERIEGRPWGAYVGRGRPRIISVLPRRWQILSPLPRRADFARSVSGPERGSRRGRVGAAPCSLFV